MWSIMDTWDGGRVHGTVMGGMPRMACQGGMPFRSHAYCNPEDFCFVCFGGGKLKVCDRKYCPKAYHPNCISWEKSNYDGNYLNCEWHTCSNCEKDAHYLCNTCTYSLCKGCISEANFSSVRGGKGFCKRCMEIVMLIEKSGLGNQEMSMDVSGEDSSDEEDKDTPEKAEQGKKMPAESATKTPVTESATKTPIAEFFTKTPIAESATKTPVAESATKTPIAESTTNTPVADKEAKLVIPQIPCPDGEKTGGHISTPNPSTSYKLSKKRTRNVDRRFECTYCHKKFSSDSGLQSHAKAKH